MRGLRRGIVSLALAGALATGGFIGGMMLSGGAATAATGGTGGSGVTGTTVAATASPSASPKSNESAAHEKQETAAQEQAENSGTARHTCLHPSSSASATSTSSNV